MSAADTDRAEARLTLTQTDPIQRIVLEGRLDNAGVDALELKFNAATAASGKSAIVDLAGVTFITSLGIRMLVTAAKRMSASGRTLVLLGPRGLVDDSLKSIDLYRLIPLADDEQDALTLAGA